MRAILDGPEPYDRALWRGLADMGLLGIVVPEAYGGLGLSYLELCVVAEELGRDRLSNEKRQTELRQIKKEMTALNKRLKSFVL